MVKRHYMRLHFQGKYRNNIQLDFKRDIQISAFNLIYGVVKPVISVVRILIFIFLLQGNCSVHAN